MRKLALAVCLLFAFSPLALAQEKKAPSAAQKKQQERMMSAQQERMKTCNRQASDKKMKGDDGKKFMSDCLKG